MKRLIPFILIVCGLITHLHACTTAIVSGKFTPDGRPLLFKHRDTGKLQNKLMFFTDGKYNYMGLVNAADLEGKELWAGINSAGFAIMNSASYNLNENDTTSLKDREGIVMKMALQSCATVDDFEALLRRLPKPLGVEANFGVIDAEGGAAYFETAQRDFVKIDVNDPQLAPFGYVIRTNYSFARDQDKGYGYIRFMNAEKLFYQAAATGDLSARFILQDVSRCLDHSLTGVNLWDDLPRNCKDAKFISFEDFIPRHSSAATTVVHGVRPDESPEFTTMWTILGWQLCSVAVPAWIKGGKDLPPMMLAGENGLAPLCDKAMTLKKRCYPITRGSGRKYMNVAPLINKEETGILQTLKPLESKILKKTDAYLNEWRQGDLSAENVKKYYQWIQEEVTKFYKEKFSL